MNERIDDLHELDALYITLHIISLRKAATTSPESTVRALNIVLLEKDTRAPVWRFQPGGL